MTNQRVRAMIGLGTILSIIASVGGKLTQRRSKTCAVSAKNGSSQCCASSRGLTLTQRRVLGFVMDRFIRGETRIGARDVMRFAGLESIAEAKKAIHALHRDRGLLHYDDQADRFLAVFPFSPRPTPIQVRLSGGRAIYAMCGYDALGIPGLFREDGVVFANSPLFGRRIRIHVSKDGSAEPDPGGSLLWISTSQGSWAERKCGETLFFVSAKELAQWRREHPGYTGYQADIRAVMPEVNQRFAWMGDLLPRRS